MVPHDHSLKLEVEVAIEIEDHSVNEWIGARGMNKGRHWSGRDQGYRDQRAKSRVGVARA